MPTAPLRLGRRLLSSQLVESLVTPNPIERYVELVNPLWSRRDVRAEVEEVSHQTARSVTLALRPNANWQGFEAGQHVGVSVEINGVLNTRFYSPAGSAHNDDGRIEITVSEHEGGVVSPYMVEHALPGMVLRLTQAEGDFILPDPRPGHLLLISGGSGITPVISMLRTLCDERHGGHVAFLHYARTKRDRLYAHDLKQLAAGNPNVRVLTVYTRGDGGDLSGRFSRKHLTEAGYRDDTETYVCGPASLIEAVERVWARGDFALPLHTERFAPPPPAVVVGKPTGTIRFAKSGIEVKSNGESLLAQAEAAGLNPNHGCRMGICHTCIAHMKSGSVRHMRTGELKTVTDEIVQICINAPVGDVEINL